MTLPKSLLPDRQRALIQLLRVAVLSLPPSDQGPVMESLSHSKGGHALGFCFLVVGVALPRSCRGKIMTGRGHVGVARTQGLLPNRQRALEEPLRFPGLPLVAIQVRQ